MFVAAMRTIIVIAIVKLTEAFLSCPDICKLLINGPPECFCILEGRTANRNFDDNPNFYVPIEHIPYRTVSTVEPVYTQPPIYQRRNVNKVILGRNKIQNKQINVNQIKRQENSIQSLNLKNKERPFYLDVGLTETISNSRFTGPVLKAIENPEMIEQTLKDCLNLQILVGIREGNEDSKYTLDNREINKYTDLSDSQLLFEIQKKCTRPFDTVKASLEELRNTSPIKFHRKHNSQTNQKFYQNNEHYHHNVAAKFSTGKKELEESTIQNASRTISNRSTGSFQNQYPHTDPSQIQENLLNKTFKEQTARDGNLKKTTLTNKNIMLKTTIPIIEETSISLKVYETKGENLTTYLEKEPSTTNYVGTILITHELKEFHDHGEAKENGFEMNQDNKEDKSSSRSVTNSADTNKMHVNTFEHVSQNPITLQDEEINVEFLSKEDTDLNSGGTSPSHYTTAVNKPTITENPYIEDSKEKTRYYDQDEPISDSNHTKIDTTFSSETTVLKPIELQNDYQNSYEVVGSTISPITERIYEHTENKVPFHSLGKHQNSTSLGTTGENQEESPVLHNVTKISIINSQMQNETNSIGTKFVNDVSTIINDRKDGNIEQKQITENITRNESESFVPIVNGELYFLFRGFSIPARFVQDNGNIKVGVDGTALCNSILKSDLNNSTIISSLCKCLISKNCTKSLYNDVNYGK